MNPFDMLGVTILAFCVIRGTFRGLIKELSSILGVLAGFYAAYNFYDVIAKIMEGWFANPAYLNIVSFLLLFCTVFFVVSIIGVVIKYLLNIAFMGWFDRLCGMAFGFVKGVLIVAVLFMTFTTFLPKGSPVVKDSLLGPHVAHISETMAKVVSKDLKRQFSDKIEELKSTWKISK